MTKSMNLSKDLENKIKKYMEYIWDQEERVNPELERAVLSRLSPSLKEAIFFETGVKNLKAVHLFDRIFSDKTLLKLAKMFRKIRYHPEELIYKVNI